MTLFSSVLMTLCHHNTHIGREVRGEVLHEVLTQLSIGDARWEACHDVCRAVSFFVQRWRCLFVLAS